MLLKIYTNLINNPNQTQKYGDLNVNKMAKKLSKCKPAIQLLAISGFEINETETRCIWKNTTKNVTLIKHIKSILSMIILPTKTNNKGNDTHMSSSVNNQNTAITSFIEPNLNTTDSTVCCSVTKNMIIVLYCIKI